VGKDESPDSAVPLQCDQQNGGLGPHHLPGSALVSQLMGRIDGLQSHETTCTVTRRADSSCAWQGEAARGPSAALRCLRIRGRQR
jgi:hypothetical protein